jgi:hypothetical protein
MLMQRTCLLGLSLVLALVAVTVLCQADEPKKADPDNRLSPEAADQALEEIAAAYQVAAAGRKTGSPEALLAAAKILSRLNGKEIGLVKLEGVKPIKVKRGDKGKPTPGEPIKEEGQVVSFEAQIRKLKEDARKLNSPRDENLAALIDKVEEKARGSLRGPAWITGHSCTCGSDAFYTTNEFVFTFVGQQPARVLVRNTSGHDIVLWIVNDEGTQIGRRQGRGDLEIRWRPAFTRKFHVFVGCGNEDEASVPEFDVFKN